ncbi:MAG TPA: hypothetical protein VH639_29005 [Bryobacteraceae bacterium]|jgi:hypothetical protein
MLLSRRGAIAALAGTGFVPALLAGDVDEVDTPSWLTYAPNPPLISSEGDHFGLLKKQGFNLEDDFGLRGSVLRGDDGNQPLVYRSDRVNLDFRGPARLAIKKFGYDTKKGSTIFFGPPCFFSTTGKKEYWKFFNDYAAWTKYDTAAWVDMGLFLATKLAKDQLFTPWVAMAADALAVYAIVMKMVRDHLQTETAKMIRDSIRENQSFLVSSIQIDNSNDTYIHESVHYQAYEVEPGENAPHAVLWNRTYRNTNYTNFFFH